MKKFLISTVTLLTTISLSAEAKFEVPVEREKIQNREGYFSYGFGLPGLLGLNIGFRSQDDHHGYEFGMGGVPLVLAFEVHAFANYLHYPSPGLGVQNYFGIGARGGYLAEVSNFGGRNRSSGAGYVAPGLIFGRSYRNGQNCRRFVQVAVSPGGYYFGEFRPLPAISISHGFSF